MKRTNWYAAMIHPVESALPSRAVGIQQGGDESATQQNGFLQSRRK